MDTDNLTRPYRCGSHIITYLDIVYTVHLLDLIISVQQMHSLYICLQLSVSVVLICNFSIRKRLSEDEVHTSKHVAVL
jgi:hypothetical protein